MSSSPPLRLMFRLLSSAAIFFAAIASASSEEHPDYGRRIEADQRLKTLEMLISKIQQNHQQIKSWRGSYEATSRHRVFAFANPSLPQNQRNASDWVGGGQPLDRGSIQTGPEAGDGHWLIRKGMVRFSLDVAEKKCHSFYSALDSIGIIDVPTGIEMRSTQPGESLHWLITDDTGIEFETLQTRGRLQEFQEIDPIRSGRVLYRRPPKNMSQRGYMVDPRDLLTNGNYSNKNRYPWRNCEMFSAMLRGELSQKVTDLAQEKLAIYVSAADPPVYTIVLPFEHGETVSQYDGTAGFNHTKDSYAYDKEGRKSRTLHTTTYREVSGVFLPDKLERQDHSDVPDENRRSDMHSSYRLLDTELNQPIPKDEFEITSLGLTYGDRLHDVIQQKLYIYDDQAGFILASELNFDPSRVKKPIQK